MQPGGACSPFARATFSFPSATIEVALSITIADPSGSGPAPATRQPSAPPPRWSPFGRRSPRRSASGCGHQGPALSPLLYEPELRCFRLLAHQKPSLVRRQGSHAALTPVEELALRGSNGL